MSHGRAGAVAVGVGEKERRDCGGAGDVFERKREGGEREEREERERGKIIEGLERCVRERGR